jgi:hypothetical protein
MTKTFEFIEELRALLKKYDAIISHDTDNCFQLWLTNENPVNLNWQHAPRVGDYFDANILDIKD